MAESVALRVDELTSTFWTSNISNVAHFFKGHGHVHSSQLAWPKASDVILGLVLLMGSAVLFVLFKFGLNYYYSPVKSFPGPVCTAFTDLWRYFKTASGKAHLVHAELHQKYGSVVRIGPNTLSLSDTRLLKTIYNTKNPWKKTRMYQVQESVRPDGTPQPNLFSAVDEKWHAMVTKPVSSYLSSNKSVLSCEKFLDSSIDLLNSVLIEKFVNEGRPCDINDWFLRFSWDAMGWTTFGSSLGFLNGSLKNSEKLLWDSDRDFDYFAKTSQMPWLHYILKTNRIARAINASQLEWAVNLSIEHYTKRVQMRKQQEKDQKSEVSAQDQDFLDKYLEAQQKYPDLIDNYQMISYLLTNTVAGSHPTAYTLTALVYYVLSTKGVYAKLRAELESASLLGREEPVSYKDARSLTYLEAVVREAIRIHPGFSLILERVVPEEVDGHKGLLLPDDGTIVPPGTAVGMAAWVINRDEEVFGSEPESFMPERWLQYRDETVVDFTARRQRMFNTVLSFGSGTRVCLGQSLALVQLYKTVASFFAAFDVKLVHPEQELEITDAWTMRTENLHVSLRRNKARKSTTA